MSQHVNLLILNCFQENTTTMIAVEVTHPAASCQTSVLGSGFLELVVWTKGSLR